MINYEALFKISYGLYVICSGNKEKGNGFVGNTVMQVTSYPMQIAVCCNKNNFTAELIAQTGVLSVSILPQTVSPTVIGTFGYKSGRDIDKLKDFEVRYGIQDVPVLLTDAIATLECKINQAIDSGTHYVYICEVTDATLLNDSDPITYDYYRKVKKGVSPQNAPTYVDESKKETAPTSEKHRCLVCGYVYDDAENDIPFAELDGDDYECPVCQANKGKFVKIE